MMTMASMTELEEKFSRLLLENTLSKLDGTDPTFKEIEMDSKPHRRVIIGTLAPKNVGEEKKTIVNTTAKSVTFLLEKFEPFKVEASLCVFYKTKESTVEGDETKETGVWKRKSVNIPVFEVKKPTGSFKIDFEKTITDIQSEARRLNAQWEAEVTVETDEYQQEGKKYALVTVTILNDTEENKRYETTLFDAVLKISLESKIQPFIFHYNYEGYDESYEMDLQTNNCGADYDKETNTISTTHFKIFEQPKILPKDNLESLDGIEQMLEFDTLSKHPDNLGLLIKVHDELNQYLKFYKGLVGQNPQLEGNGKYNDSLKNFQTNIDRFKEGIDVLESSKTVRQAFELMQKTFSETNKGEYSGWRLFQLVFIVSLIPDIVKKDLRRDIAELLHVDTGGGKSEAYFGIVVFSAFFDRLTGKEFGITGLTKFPLRMVAIQQFQRIIKLFAWAEEIKKQNDIPGHPFSIGYFVGNSDEFPRHNYKIVNKIQSASSPLPGKFIEDCPICHKENSVKLRVDEDNFSIIHKCNSCDRTFRFYYCDDEIYRLVPTFIISTVDKLAGVGSNRRFRNLFGGSLNVCSKGHGYIPRGDRCEAAKTGARSKGCAEDGVPQNIDFCQGPSMVVQDEMHLVKEGFGTIDSHFETMMEHLQNTLKGTRFKNIVMTATVSGAKGQIKELYNKNVRIFPGDAPYDQKGVNDFYYKNFKGQNNRILVGLSPNMRDNQFASLLTLRHIAELINEVQNNKEKYAKILEAEVSDIDALLKSYKNILTYHNKKSDVNGMVYYLRDVVNSKLEQQGIEIKKESLTGELELDEIKDIIKKVDSFDGSKNKDLQAVFATNVVSHGVDIKNWNMMVFQGIPRNTSEYIQALSRTGRHHLGLVFLWFYPNMIRDQSFYQNFKQYHEILGHHVEPVPISRWAKLGFFQTFNSLFCATILNYFPEISGTPMYTVDSVNEFFSTAQNYQENRGKLKEFLEHAYVTHINEVGSEYFLNNVGTEIEKRLGMLLNYSGGSRYFFPNALQDCSERYFRNQFGMRGIQDTISLSANADEEPFLRNYKKEAGMDDSDDE
jgi:hypothetical protein